MAENKDNTPSIQSSGSSNVNTNTFNKGMMKDYNESFIGDGLYTHARNAVNSSHDGQVGPIGNEPSNLFCVDLPYTMIGCVHLTDDQWIIFSTDDTNSEIGIFDESACTYEALKSPEGNLIDFNCLGLKKTNLITGVSRKRFDCDRIVYFDDGLNPTRTLDVNKVPVIQNCAIPPGGTCQICTEVITAGKATLNCEAIRIAPFVTHPCINIKRGEVSGTLPNGSYQAAIAYLINGSRVTDYLGLSEVQSLWTHDNTNSSLEITIESIDPDYEEFDLVILSNINNQSVAKKIGTYSTTQGTIYVDRWSGEFVTVSISDIILRTEPIEKSDALYSVGKYLLRVGSYSKFKFNYQPLANQINTKWVAVEYPADYYVKQNNATGYMRDEVYSFFIRFIYNTGEYSESYHIPGRPSTLADTSFVTGGDAFEGTLEKWKVYNTATVTSTTSSQPSYLNGGQIIASGQMGYWESTERYPGNKSEIWDSFPATPGNNLNLCGKAIRHHKMPDETIHPKLQLYNNTNNKIVLLGVEFDNISFPVDNNGNPITSIVGYQILRGSREGNKSIIGKGLLNNMREYNIPNNSTKGLFQNYPFNDLRADDYLTSAEQTGDNGGKPKPSLNVYKKDYLSFHSPDTTFNNPYLNAYELKIYSLYSGSIQGEFLKAYKHPLEKQLTDALAGNGLSIVNQLTDLLSNLQIASGLIGGFDFNMGAYTDPTSANIGIQATSGVGDILGVTSEALVLAAAAANTVASIPLYGIPVLGSLSNIIQSIVNKLNNLPGVSIDLNPAVFQNLFIGRTLIRQQLIKSFYFVFPKRQFAYQFNSHGFYNTAIQNVQGNIRRKLLRSYYVHPNLQQFDPSYQINNLNRSNFIAIQTAADVYDPSQINSSYQEQSRYIKTTEGNANKRLYSFYGGLKLSIPSQYGQLESIKQIPLNTIDDSGQCITFLNPLLKYKTGVLFGGDIYINRFTEKNTMPFFTDWLYDLPDEFEFNYCNYINIPYPKYWVNFVKLSGSYAELPSDYRSLNDQSNFFGLFIDSGYFYLFNSGVRDFYVESEVNVAYRDWEDTIPKRHYDTYTFTDYNLMFRSDYIKNPNFYKYDYSLSVSKLVGSSITWGSMLDRNYDPEVAATCYTYRPDRVLYSLPQNEESRRDTWRVFLANNYRDFPSPISSIKSINKTGALFMMARQSPIQFTGVEELRMDGTNTKVTIGDGGLFNQELQSVVNTDKSYEYGSNQGRYCAINTTYGLFWVSQNQGKVFQYANGLNDITNGGLKWWFAKYLPSELLKRFPDYPLYDNPVIGVGCQMIYDNTYDLIYITKRDWKPIDPSLKYNSTTNSFYIPGTSSVTYTCPDGYTLNGNVCTKDCCPEGYTLTNGECVKILTADPIPVGSVVNLTPTPYIEYGKGTTVPGTSSVLVYPDSVYHNNLASALAAGAVQLDPGNSFWGFDSGASDTQAGQLNNGPVNRLSKWGLVNDPSGNPYNNYNTPGGAGNLLPIDVWTGFTTCLTIDNETTYHVCVAADNRFRILVDGTIVLGSPSTTTFNFNFLHIYPITIAAGSHTLVVEGINEGAKACFAVEIFDLNNLPGGQTPVQYLNAQTDYTNLDARTIFSTRTATQFTSGTYICPPGYTASSSGNCTIPTCTLTEIIPAEQCTIPATEYIVENNIPCPFEDERCFEPANWTISYDPKIKAWISFHDWIPTFVIPGKNHFMTVDYDSIWKHNIRCDSYCNYYGINYPFEIEFVSTTGQQVNTMRSIEYMLEVYNYSNDCADRFHVLDQNFDQAVVYNSEQISGNLLLALKDKTNPFNMLTYPLVDPVAQTITINFSKEENKYRFNQFWDITNDRGEFTGGNTPMFITGADGYKYNINPTYVNYSKDPLQHKKFRHYVNRVFLRKSVSGNNKMLFKISNEKLLQSPR